MSLTIAPIESKTLWESFVTGYAPQSLFQSWVWGEVQKKQGIKIWRMGLFDGDDLVGVAAIYKIQAKRGTYLHVRHGPLFISQKKAYWQKMLAYWKELADIEHAWFIRISPLLSPSNENAGTMKDFGFIPSPMHAVDAEMCWVLDIDVSEEVLLGNMRKTTRYDIRRALKENVAIRTSTDLTYLTSFLSLYSATADRQKFVGHTGVRDEFELFTKDGKALLFLGSLGDEVVSGALVLFYGNQAIYHHGASIRSRIPVSSLVLWEAILEAKKRGFKVYNFWGIAPDESQHHPWKGLTLFKKGFGGRMIRYLHAQDYPTSRLYVISKTIETTRRKLKGYDG